MSIAKRLIAILALCGAASAANATVITYTDTINPTPDITLSATGATGTVKSYSFTHDIADQGFKFDKYSLLSAELTVFLIDNVNKGNESFTFRLGSGAFAESYEGSNVANGNQEVAFPFTLKASLNDLAADGKITVMLTALEGDFMFTSSELVAKADDNTPPVSPVPEPGSLALLGLGLSALGLRRRNR